MSIAPFAPVKYNDRRIPCDLRSTASDLARYLAAVDQAVSRASR